MNALQVLYHQMSESRSEVVRDTLIEIAEALNRSGYRTQTGKRFGAVQVKRLLDRAR